MGTRGTVAIGLLCLSASAARADHYDDLGVRVDAPGGAALADDGHTISGVLDVDGVQVDINVMLADAKDWSPKSPTEMFLAAQTLPGSGGHEINGAFRVFHGHTVVSETWEANDKDMRFESVLFPTAKGLYIASWSTSKADFDKTRAQRTAFFRRGIAFDGGAPGAELPHSDLLDRLKTATGPDGFAQLADAKVKVTFTDTKKSRQLVRAKIDQAAWDADVGPLFAELLADGDAVCTDAKLLCVLDTPIGPSVEYRFKKAKGGARLVEIKTTSK